MSTKKFTAQTFAWLRLLKSDRDMTALAVGVQLTEHFNEKDGGRAWAGCIFIAKELGLSESTVIRAVHRMHARGRLRVEWGKQGRGHSNQYWMIIKPAPAQVLDAGKPVPAPAIKPAPAPRKPASAHMNHLKNHEEGAIAPSSRERENGSRSLTVIPGAPAPFGGALEGKEVTARSFACLWARWSSERSFPDTDDDEREACKAFVVICRENPDIAGEIIAAAPKFIAAVKAKGFNLPKLWKWLRRDNWRKQPPARRQHNAGKPAMAEMMLRRGQQP